MSTEIDRLSELAKEDPKRQFFSIAHLITPEKMYAAFLSLRKVASAGVDGVTHEEYEKDAARNIRELHQRLQDGKYRAQPLRRVYIPKENGKQRPISIPALEDKIVQKVMVEILNAIYEQDFLDCSYGFRPGRGAHQALDEVGRVICTRPTGWILEVDVTSYFDTIVREQLIEMIEKRVSDDSVLRLIRKWILHNRHWRRWEQQEHLKRMLRGFYQYFGLHHCERKLSWVRLQVQRQWISALNRRGQRRRTNWARLKDRPWFELPFAQNLHPMV